MRWQITFAAMLLATASSAMEPARAGKLTEVEVLTTFEQNIFITSSERTGAHLVKWAKPVRIAVHGDREGEIRSALGKIVEPIGTAANLDIRFSNSDINYLVILADDLLGEISGRYRNAARSFFTSDQEFASALADIRRTSETCFSRAALHQGHIQGVLVVAQRNFQQPTARKCAVQSVAAGFGILKYHTIQHPSIFNTSVEAFDMKKERLTEEDLFLFSILYDAALPPGITPDVGRAVLQQIYKKK